MNSTRRARASGLIPAHAGSTLQSRGSVSNPTAHPRSRGVDARSRAVLRDVHGSSPLTRGRLRRTRRLREFSWAHPRSRGVDISRTDRRDGPAGSSPLTRGRRRHPAPQLPRRGLIPAHAGSTRSVRPAPLAARAHPRSRGVDPTPRQTSSSQRGSSPLTRGRPTSLQCWHL
ncbi:hypothetical protein HMPREF0058_1575 [Actinomyces urogenitalis DSM 15434]|nr:hypothetical protein HMPREF0058_1575 [Actinomyces urogenitalis DSM 15434]